MKSFKIALLQMFNTQNIKDNLAKGIDFCKKAKELGADLALFPEAWQLGYEPKLMNIHNAIQNTDIFISEHIKLAKELNMAIAVTYIKNDDGKAKNNVIVIDRFGNIILEYAKVHICDFEGGFEKELSPGDSFNVAELEFSSGKVHLGAMICMDREFCESARTLMLKGAEIVITPNSCLLATCEVLKDARLAGFRSLGYQNLIGVAMTNYAAPKEDGHSCAFDASSRPIIIADGKEQVAIAEFDLEHLRKIRENEWECRGIPARKVPAYILN